MAFVIARPINGISLNGLEYVLDENGEDKTFDTKEGAYEFLKSVGYDEDSMEREGIIVKDLDDYKDLEG